MLAIFILLSRYNTLLNHSECMKIFTMQGDESADIHLEMHHLFNIQRIR